MAPGALHWAAFFRTGAEKLMTADASGMGGCSDRWRQICFCLLVTVETTFLGSFFIYCFFCDFVIGVVAGTAVGILVHFTGWDGLGGCVPKMKRFVKHDGLPGRCRWWLLCVAGATVAGQGAGFFARTGRLLVAGDTVVVIYGHIRFGGAVLQTFELEYETLLFLKMAGTAVLVRTQDFRVSVVGKRNRRHFVTTGDLRQVD